MKIFYSLRKGVKNESSSYKNFLKLYYEKFHTPKQRDSITKSHIASFLVPSCSIRYGSVKALDPKGGPWGGKPVPGFESWCHVYPIKLLIKYFESQACVWISPCQESTGISLSVG
jgi:hypothetical protein